MELLPDDPSTADRIVQLLSDKAALLKMLRRMREERDYWRHLATVKANTESEEVVYD